MSNNFNRRILVVDDNRAIHDDFRKILSPAARASAYGDIAADLFGESAEQNEFVSFEVDVASQGREGLQMVKQALAEDRPYSVAFIDVRMPPGWDGIETTAEIWKICPELQVVICTAYSDYDWASITRKLGQTDRLLILKKPFDTVEVLQMAETLAQKWTLAQQARLRMSDLDAMVNQRTQELRVSNEQLAAFTSLGSLLNGARTTQVAGQIILDTADRLLGYDACMLDLYSPETDILTRVLHADLINGQRKECFEDDADRPPSPMLRKTLLEGGQLVLKSDPTRMLPDGQPFGDTSRPSAAIMFVPIHNGTSVIGILSIQSYTPNAYDQRKLETLQALADHCGGALNRIRTEEALQDAEEKLRQSQKLEAIGQLAGGVAHDFNNLLTVIGGNADLARRQVEGSSGLVAECLDQITAAGDRAANLTRQLLAFSRKQMMRSHPVDPAAFITNLSKMLNRLIGENVDLKLHYPSAVPSVRADIGMLEQAFINLAVNASEAMPDGGKLLITVEPISFNSNADTSHPEARPGDFVRIAIKDTGTGISPKNLPRIFEPFFTTKDVGKGPGLGLATVYGIVKQHQGWIEVSSQVGIGSTFSIYLPALESATAAANERALEKSGPPRGKEIDLLVEK